MKISLDYLNILPSNFNGFIISLAHFSTKIKHFHLPLHLSNEIYSRMSLNMVILFGYTAISCHGFSLDKLHLPALCHFTEINIYFYLIIFILLSYQFCLKIEILYIKYKIFAYTFYFMFLYHPVLQQILLLLL